MASRTAIEALCATLRRERHRGLLVLAGGRAPAFALAAELLPEGPDLPWIAERATPAQAPLSPHQARRLLGRDLRGAVYDLEAGVDPDALGIVTGAVRGGGLICLLAPPLARWPDLADPERAQLAVTPYPPDAVGGRFLARLAATFEADPHTLIVDPERTALPVGARAAAPETAGPTTATAPITADQSRAVTAVQHLAEGRARRPRVLIADRGRGKSSALGIAAARLLRAGLTRILVTAPRTAAVEAVFARIGELEPQARRGPGYARLDAAEVRFLPPDALLREQWEARLLLVDEAAALPAPVLAALLERYRRIAFATTVHGYEGTGRGFDVRFRATLDARTPAWRELRLTTPIRFAPDDPVERVMFRALLLDAAPAPDIALAGLQGSPPDALAFEWPERDALAANETLLAESFGLLVLAHYRTRPFDLRFLLDAPGVEIGIARYHGHVAGVCLVAREGGFDPALAEAIRAGHRRPQGHLAPEALASHLGLADGARLRSARILRLAVHPAARRCRVASRLLSSLADRTEHEDLDLLTSSFSATADVLALWRHAGYLPVRMGVRRDASSGAYSVLVLRPISPAGRRLFTAARRYHARHVDTALADVHADLDPGVAAAVLAGHAQALPGADEADLTIVAAFTRGERGAEDSLGALRRVALKRIAEGAAERQLSPDAFALLVRRVVQLHGWADCVTQLGLSGHRAALAMLRTAMAMLLAEPG